MMCRLYNGQRPAPSRLSRTRTRSSTVARCSTITSLSPNYGTAVHEVQHDSSFRRFNASAIEANLSSDGRVVTLRSGSVERSFHGEQLLRLDPTSKESESNQFVLNSYERAPRIKAVRFVADQLQVNWDNPAKSRRRNRPGTLTTSHFSMSELTGLSSGISAPRMARPLLFTGPDPAPSSALARISWSSLVHAGQSGMPSSEQAQERAAHGLLQAVNAQGCALVTGCPTTHEEGVLSIARTIGVPMHTIYGPTWSVQAVPHPVNIAYTQLGLDLHQDLAYYESPPGLQLLHCLAFDSNVRGGDSTFMCAHTAANLLRVRHPRHFIALTRLPCTFQKVHYARERPVHLQYRRPHISVAGNAHIAAMCESDLLASPVTGVFWSPPFEGHISLPESEQRAYWDARAAFADVLRDMESGAVNEEEERSLRGAEDKRHTKSSDKKTPGYTGLIQFRLAPGECVVFNNRRMLHGRRAFQLLDTGNSLATQTNCGPLTQTGRRLLQGCYVSSEDYTSRLQHLNSVFGGDSVHVGNQNWM